MTEQKYTQEQIDKRKSDQICWDCGGPFLEESTGGVVTANPGKCGLCGEKKMVTHMRVWNYLKLKKTT